MGHDGPKPSFLKLAAGLVLIAGAATALSLAMLNDYQNWGDDWAQYVLQARAILDGRAAGYLHDNAFMVNQSSSQVGPIGYPWGVPLLFAAAGRVFAFDLHTFKLVNIALLAGIVIITALYAQRLGVAIGGALAAAALVAFNPTWLVYVNHLLSELPFVCASMAWLLAATPRSGGNSVAAGDASLRGLLGFVTSTIRINGVLPVMAGVANTLWDARRLGARRTALLVAAEVATFAIAFVIWSTLFPEDNSSHARLLDNISVTTIARNLFQLPTALLGFFAGGRSAIVAWLFFPFALIGAVRSWPMVRPTLIYGALTIGLYVVWPGADPYRFMMPLMPVIAVFVVNGLAGCAEWTSGWWSRAWRGAMIGLPVLFLAAAILIASRQQAREAWHPYDRPSQEMFAWIRDHTRDDAVVAFFKPRVMHLLAHRLSLTAQVADVPKVSYLVYGKRSEWVQYQSALDALQRSATLDAQFENENFIVFAVTPGKTSLQ